MYTLLFTQSSKCFVLRLDLANVLFDRLLNMEEFVENAVQNKFILVHEVNSEVKKCNEVQTFS